MSYLSEQLQEVNFLIVGKTGNGKSSTGNSILGKDCFPVSFSVMKGTLESRLVSNIVDGYRISVLDNPGLGDTGTGDGTSLDKVMEAFDRIFLREGLVFHAIVVVLQLGARMTKEETSAIEDLKGMLGANVLKDHAVVAFTGGDSFVGRTKGRLTFDQWCREQRGELQKILQECSYRCVLFNNVTEDMGELKKQRDTLIGFVHYLKHYTMEEFRTAQIAYERANKEKQQEEKCTELYIAIGRLSVQMDRAIKRNDALVLDELKDETNRLKVLVGELLEGEEKDKLTAQIKHLDDKLRNPGRTRNDQWLSSVIVKSLILSLPLALSALILHILGIEVNLTERLGRMFEAVEHLLVYTNDSATDKE